MSAEPASVRATRAWVRLYTRGLPAHIGARRVLEIESDLWEHLHDPGTADREILGRTLRGIHADVWWRYRTLLEHRGARQRSHEMTTTTTRGWWTPVTMVLAAVVAIMGLLGLMFRETDGGGGALALAAGLPGVGGVLILLGLVARRHRHVRGSRMVIAGAVLCALADPLLIPVGAAIIIGGLWTGELRTGDAPDRPDLQVTRHSITATWWRWLAAAAALGLLGFAVLLVWEHSGAVPDSCSETNPCWEEGVAWATWVLSWLAAMVTGGIGGVLAVLHLLARHHTRPA